MAKKNEMNLSFIFPVFNEGERLELLFKKIILFNNKHLKNAHYIFINDGSLDNSLKLLKYFKKNNKNLNIRIYSYKKNRGKGYALKKGIQISKTNWLLTLDVDLSVDLNQILSWKKKIIFNKNCAYIGSRNLISSKVKTIFIRILIGKIMNILLYSFLKIELKDTQCGFKLYHKSYIKRIFRDLSIKGYAHDVEILMKIKKKRINIVELPVNWSHKAGSKVNLLTDSIKFFLNIIYIRLKL